MQIAIIISSCRSFCDKTLPPLLESLHNARVPGQDTFVVIGECEADGHRKMGDVNVFERTWANMDNNAMLWLASACSRDILAAYEWVFYMHDTCVVEPEFHLQLYEILDQHLSLDPNLSALRVYKDFYMSMGYYKLSDLWDPETEGFIWSTANYDQGEDAKMNVKRHVEDIVFKHLEQRGMSDTFIEQDYTASEPRTDIYGTGNQRIVETWLPGFKKNKANWYEFLYLHL